MNQNVFAIIQVLPLCSISMAEVKNSFGALAEVEEPETSVVVDIFKQNNKRKDIPSVSSDDQSPISKKQFFESENMEDDNIPVEQSLKIIRELLKTLATKDSMNNLQNELTKEMNKMRETFDNSFKEYKKHVDDQLGHFESRLYNVEMKMDNIVKENEELKFENETLRDRLLTNEKGLNDLEQYGRRWNLRVFNVEEKSGETTQDVTKRVCDIFTDMVKVKTEPSDIEACHRTGNLEKARHDKKVRPIIVRFNNRSLKDDVLRNRSKLKGKGLSIGEDLTPYNAKLCKDAYKHEAVDKSYSINGKVFVRLKDDRKLRLHYGCDVVSFLNEASKTLAPAESVDNGENNGENENMQS